LKVRLICIIEGASERNNGKLRKFGAAGTWRPKVWWMSTRWQRRLPRWRNSRDY